MKKNSILRMTTFISAVAVTLSTAASCSNNSASKSPKKADEVLTASYSSVRLDCSDEISDINNILRLGDTGNILISCYDYDTNTPYLYITDEEFTDLEKINIDLGLDDYDSAYISSGASPDGTIFLLANISDYGDFEVPDYDDPDFDFDSFDFDAMYDAMQTYYKLYTVDTTGSILSEADLTDIAEGSDYAYLGNMTPIGKDKVFFSFGDDQNYAVVSTEGEILASVDLSSFNWIDSTAVNADGQLAVTGYSDSSMQLRYFNAETLSPEGDEISFEGTAVDNINRMFTGTGDYSLYIVESSALYGLDKDGELTELINWVDSDIPKYSVSSMIALDNGDFIAYIDDYDTNDHGFYRLTKRDSEELSNTRVVTIAMLYDDWEVSSEITKFNKAHDDIRIKVVNYSKYDQYDEENEEMISSAAGQLKMDIVSGKSPDMIVTYDRTLVTSLASKGLYADLYEYLDNDSDLSREDIMPNVLAASEIDGKLYSLAPGFSVSTYAVKSKFFDKENWTLDDLISTYESLPDGTKLFQWNSKESVFANLIYSMGSLVDYEKGTCSFDSPDFMKTLEFANQFPDEDDELDWETATDEEMQEYWNEQDIAFMNDKTLIDTIYLYELRQYATERYATFNDDITLVGAPSPDGNGSSLTFSSSFAILNNSAVKDECWSFIKCFFTDEYYESDNFYMLPSLTTAFEKKADEAMERPYWTDENGNKEYYDDTTYINGKEITIPPLSQEERDYLVDYIKNTTKEGSSYAEDVGNIVYDEIQAYFKGEKTAQETADIIQNRVSILISEQS